ncbi:hypothetical protein WKW50_22100 [Ochrobactrum sp. GPK 3]
MSTIDDYKAAMIELAEAKKQFEPITAFFGRVNAATSGSTINLLHQTFGMKDTVTRSSSSFRDLSKYRLDFKNWLTGEEIEIAGKRLAKAFNEAHRVYGELPPEDKTYIKSPPSQP